MYTNGGLANANPCNNWMLLENYIHWNDTKMALKGYIHQISCAELKTFRFLKYTNFTSSRPSIKLEPEMFSFYIAVYN